MKIRWSARPDCITIGCLWIRHRLLWPSGIDCLLTGQQANGKIIQKTKRKQRESTKMGEASSELTAGQDEAVCVFYLWLCMLVFFCRSAKEVNFCSHLSVCSLIERVSPKLFNRIVSDIHV